MSELMKLTKKELIEMVESTEVTVSLPVVPEFKEDSAASKELRQLLTKLLEDIRSGKLEGKKALFKDYTRCTVPTVRTIRDQIKLPHREEKLQEALQHLATVVVSELVKIK